MPINRAAYLKEIHANLPRLLALFDVDATSRTCGIGDRYHWAWSLIDFGNGTYQGAANGLARLLTNKLLPERFDEKQIIRRIDAIFAGADYLRRADGSLEEAFPYEGSFCVTALVAYDLLTAIELLQEQLPWETRKKYLGIVRPMIDFLLIADETHAFIANHLATAAAALIKWAVLTGDKKEENRGKAILGCILAKQSNEGWFPEYEGADPGYQTLCTYYLADIYRMKPEYGMLEPLRKSVCFLWHFAHPDGSFGGIYGSRNTRLYYPAGFEFLADEIPEAASLACYMRESIAKRTVVTLSAMDEPNLVPMFNAYCWAATLAKDIKITKKIPCHQKNFRRHWREAGLLVDCGENHYTIVSLNKGGVVYHYVEGRIKKLDAGVSLGDQSGKLYSTQGFSSENRIKIRGNNISVEAAITPMTKNNPVPWQFVVLRILNITVMRIRSIRELIKRLLVRLLVTGSNRTLGCNRRSIDLGENLKISDITEVPAGMRKVENTDNFVAIHMASKGYWQIQDDE